MKTAKPCHCVFPSKARNLKSPIHVTSPSYWLQGSIHRVWHSKSKTTNNIPLSLDGRGPKPVPVPDTGARVKTMPLHRHVIADLIRNPEGGGEWNPLSLDGRGIKGEGDPAIDTGAEGEQDHQSHGQPTMAAHVTDCTRNNHP